MMRPAILGAALAMMAGTAAAQTTEPAPPAQAPSRVAGAAINVVDIERSRAFYTDVLGLKVALRVPAQGPVREYLLSPGGTIDEALVILTRVDSRPEGAARFGRVVLVVPDADALMARAAAAGTPAAEDVKLPHFLRDPDGFLIELFEMPAR